MRIRLFLLIVLITIVGCQQQNDNEALPLQNNQAQTIQVKDSVTKKDEHYDNKEIATHLANVAASVPSVNDATAIIAGPYTVVGIDIEGELDRSRVGTIKYTVSEALQHDPYGKTAVVIADGDIMDRIHLMRENIQDGYPIRGVVDELSAIVGRFMPKFPVDEDRPTREQNKDIISDDEDKELDDIQEKQSKEN